MLVASDYLAGVELCLHSISYMCVCLGRFLAFLVVLCWLIDMLGGC